MKYILFSAIFLNCVFGRTQDTTSILFIGNSHTFVKNLPQMFYELASHAGKLVYVDNATMGGYTLQMHLQNSGTIAKINERHWDYVILQEQSQIPSFIPERETMMYPYAKSLDSLIHVNWFCTKTMFFMTWAHKNGDLGILQNGGTDSFEAMQQRLRSGYLTIADSLEATVAPCGWAWRNVIQNYPLIELYSSDNYHPSENGTYLAACTFFASIFSQSAVGINYYGNVTTSNAAIFQSTASQIVLDSLDLWNIGLYNPNPIANFGYSQTGNLFNFTDSSFLANEYDWDFGDGNTSNLQNPVHHYSTFGEYNVRLISRNSCSSDTIVKTISYFLTSSNIQFINTIIIYPNPSNENIHFFSSKTNLINIQIFNSEGIKLMNFEHIPADNYTIDIKNIPNGMYIVKLSDNESTNTLKFLKY